MKILRQIAYGTLVSLAVLGGFVASARAQGFHLDAEVPVGDGWHPWYEMKADPENSKNLIICGTKWDAQRDSPFGFVYVSRDGGASWQTALEDRNSAWVTEHSCAFGSHHRAYFISEASKVVDGELYHHLGTTRLYVSTDGGRHWKEKIKTGWADFSTSAVSSLTGGLYTFFHASTGNGEPGGNHNVGLLVSSPDGRNIAGPFLDFTLGRLGYQGIYPSQAVALRSGAVVALYYGTRKSSSGLEVNLGIIHASPSPEPSLADTTISQTNIGKDCLNFNESSLAYDHERNRLFIAYVDGCTNTRIMLTSSEDEGRTWAKSVAVSDTENANRKVVYPSLVVDHGGALGLLWQEGRGSGRWLFSYIRDQKLLEPPVELSPGPQSHEVSNDSLWTVIDQMDEPRGSDPNALFDSSITLKVRTEFNSVWRASGLMATGDKILAVWPSGNSGRMGLRFAILGPHDATPKARGFDDAQNPSSLDVTQRTIILYGGTQRFDSATETLKVCLTLKNRTDNPIAVPIKLEAREIKSRIGSVSVLDSSNGLSGVGAIWDISNSIAGNRIPGLSSSNPFCLSFHTDMAIHTEPPLEGNDLLILRLRVLASEDASSQDKKQEKTKLLPDR